MTVARLDHTQKVIGSIPIRTTMTLEIVYTWPDSGREEVRYRREPHDSDDAKGLIKEVEDLKQRLGEECPYSYRVVQ